MGYTDFTKKIVIDALALYDGWPLNVLDFGSQNDYATSNTTQPPFISEWYENTLKIKYTCIDLAGDNNALKLNWSKPFTGVILTYDIVVDAGSSEHSVNSDKYDIVAFHEGYINSVYPKYHSEDQIQIGFYNCWLNKFNCLRVGGMMVNENPVTGHWPEHGYSYINQDFYHKLAEISSLEVIEIGEHCAMGNCTDGKNVYSILHKTGDKFPSFEEFNKLPIFRS